MNRRQLILTLGAGSTVVIGAAAAGWAWRKVVSAAARPEAFSASHRAMLDALAEALLPRTATPGARDIGVADWIEFVVSEAFPADARQQFLRGLDAMDAVAVGAHEAPIARLPAGELQALIQALDSPGPLVAMQVRLQGIVARRVAADSTVGRLAASVAEAPRAFGAVKELVLHGYFTSEVVQREIMRLQWA
ncbi:MAG: gluconate 2-dehydrogenase subunit 3 family protein [Steroidobacteraceae bacterium]